MNRVPAALTLFTRLPLGKWCRVETEDFRHAVPLWPMVGWATGGITAGDCCGALFLLCELACLLSACAFTLYI